MAAAEARGRAELRAHGLARLACLLAGLVLAVSGAQAQLAVTRWFAVNQEIPDGGELLDAREVSVDGADLASLQVRLRISGIGGQGANADLYASLGHGTALAVLLNRPGKATPTGFGYLDNGLDVTFADQAVSGDIHVYRQTLFGNPNTYLGVPLGGVWQPDGRLVNPDNVVTADARTAKLNVFNGLDPNGQWRLLMADLMEGGAHRLEGWSLEYRTKSGSDSTLGFGDATIEAVTGSQTLGNAVGLSGEVKTAGGNDIIFNGAVSGSGILSHEGNGTLKLNAANSFSGGINLRAGVLAIGHNSALGEGALNLAGGAVQASGGARTLANSVTVEANTTFSGTDPLRFTGATTLTGNRTFEVQNTTVFSGGIQQSGGSYGLTKSGAGLLVLDGASAYTGPTVVNQGRLRVLGSLSGSVVTVNSSGIVSGSGTIGGLVLNSGATLAPGASLGTLPAGDTTWGGGANYAWEINHANGTKGSDPGWDWLSVSGTLTITATPAQPFVVKVIGLNGSVQGVVAEFHNTSTYSWTIASATAGITGFDAAKFTLDVASFVNNNPLGLGSFSIARNGNDVNVVFTPEPGQVAFAAACGLLVWGAARGYGKVRRGRLGRRRGLWVAGALLWLGATSAYAQAAPSTAGAGSTAKGPTWDVKAKGVPQFVASNYIELEKIGQISKFRSGVGHDYSDAFETRRSMKHYFKPLDTVEWSAVKVFSPVKGTVFRVDQEWAGTKVEVQSERFPAFRFAIFHVKLGRPLKAGDSVNEGEYLGTHVDARTMSDIAVGVETPLGFKLVSWFEVLTDGAFAEYARRGMTSRSMAIISKEERDARPLATTDRGFTTPDTPEDWVPLKPAR
jgi:autotransporter-associated beta strand protein